MPRPRLVTLLGIGLLLCTLLPFVPPAFGQQVFPPSQVTVVLDDSYPPYAFRDSDGSLRGILVDEWRLWQRKTGVKVRLIGTTWEKAQLFMDRGQADVIDTISISDTRSKRYSFSDSHVDIQVPIFFPKEIGGISDANSLRGFTVGVRKGDPAEELLRRDGITALEEFPTYEAVVKAAAEGKIRVFCIDKPPALYYLNRMNLEGDYRMTQPLYEGELHWAMKRGNWNLKYVLENGFTRISTWEILSIERRWLGSPIQRVIYYQYADYVVYAAIVAGSVLLGLLLLAWSLRRRVAARTADLQRALDELRESEARFRLLAESANEIVWTMDLDGKLTYISPWVERLSGMTSAEELARPVEEKLTPTSLPVFQGMVAEAAQRIRNGARTFILPPQEIEQPHPNGSTIWTEVRMTPQFDEQGRFRHLLGVSRDISERKRREEEQRALESQMLQAQKLESLGVLAGGIAHDFNNILTAILGNAELAQNELPEGSTVRHMLLEINEASRRAADLCQQMLAYSGRGRVIMETVDLSALVRDMTHMLQVSISKKARLLPSLPEGLPCVTADATQIRQIVMNLIINASEALNEGAGTILVSTGVMECDEPYLGACQPGEPRAPGKYAYVEVADSGMGMDETTISRIFDPFFTTKFTGRGLGLAAVQGIVRSHHGAIHLESSPGQGTTFRVLLPLAEAAVPSPTAGLRSTRDWRGSGNVLLVDDEETVRSIGRLMLERLGFTVVTAADGEEAIDIFRARPADFACVVLDLTMPRMDGLETFRELRKIRCCIPVAIATGYSAQDVTTRFAGEDQPLFIQKPYRMAELAAVLQGLLCAVKEAGPASAPRSR